MGDMTPFSPLPKESGLSRRDRDSLKQSLGTVALQGEGQTPLNKIIPPVSPLGKKGGSVSLVGVLFFLLEKMSMMKEFKAFAIKGNMIDMAIGIVIG